jgi:hypothetical protein
LFSFLSKEKKIMDNFYPFNIIFKIIPALHNYYLLITIFINLYSLPIDNKFQAIKLIEFLIFLFNKFYPTIYPLK